jgi:hypothetical protein
MSNWGRMVVREIREALPATIFFLILFHMIALTKTVVLDDYSITALRATAATVGALIVAKAILVVDALPLSRRFGGGGVIHVLWKTLLYAVVVLVFRLVEESIPLVEKHGDFWSGVRSMYEEVPWPLFGVTCLWTVFGLFLYCVSSELVAAIGPARVQTILLGRRGTVPDSP